MSIQIAPASLEHQKFIASSQCSMALETENMQLDYNTVYAGITKLFQNEQLGHYYIATIDKKPVACLMTTYEWSDWRGKLVLWIQSVYVTPENRGKGIYKAMYEYIQQLVNNNPEFAGIRLYVDKSNTQAIEVYQKLGMTCEHYHLYEWMDN